MKPEEVMEGLKQCQTAVGNADSGLRNLCAPKLNNEGRAKALKQQLTDDEKDFVQYLTKALPPIIGRAEVDRFLPGLLKPRPWPRPTSPAWGRKWPGGSGAKSPTAPTR